MTSMVCATSKTEGRSGARAAKPRLGLAEAERECDLGLSESVGPAQLAQCHLLGDEVCGAILNFAPPAGVELSRSRVAAVD